MTSPLCTCPKDAEDVVTHYSTSCPLLSHSQAPPSTNWPPPEPLPPAPNCKCVYSIYGILQIDPNCQRATH